MPDLKQNKRRAIHVISALFGLLILLPSLAAAGNEKRLISVTAVDGQKLSGLLVTAKPANGAGVVLLPIYRGTKESWQPLFHALSDHGITALAIDPRGQGESRLAPDGSDLSARVRARDPALFKSMHLDAEAAVRYLLEHGTPPGRIGLVGASVGCSIAIDAITRGEVPVRAAVVMTPGTDYLGIPTMTQLDKWPGIPLLILSSEEELERGATPIYRQLKGKGAELRAFPEEDIHGTNMLGRVPGIEELIASWLAEHLQ